MRKIISLFFVIAMFGGCVTLPDALKTPEKKGSSIIAISVVNKAPISVFSVTAADIFFVKVDKKGGVLDSEEIIMSNFAKDGYVYLINAEPGKYAAIVSVGYTQRRCESYFNEELIKSTVVDVKPGDVVFMGDFVVQDEATLFVGLKEEVQKKYFDKIQKQDFGGALVYGGRLKKKNKDQKDTNEFFQSALKTFKETGWSSIIRKKMGQ